jgi:hypothetical protein
MRNLLTVLLLLLFVVNPSCQKSRKAPEHEVAPSSTTAASNPLPELPDPTTYYAKLASALPASLQNATLGAKPVKYRMEVNSPQEPDKVQRYFLEDKDFLGVLWKILGSLHDPELRERYQNLLVTELNRTPRRFYIVLDNSPPKKGVFRGIMQTYFGTTKDEPVALHLNGNLWSAPHTWDTAPEFQHYWVWSQLGVVHEFLHIKDVLDHPEALKNRQEFFAETGGKVTEESLHNDHTSKLYFLTAATDLTLETRAVRAQTAYAEQYQEVEPTLLDFPRQRELLEAYHKSPEDFLSVVYDIYAPIVLRNLDPASQTSSEVRNYFFAQIPLTSKEFEH